MNDPKELKEQISTEKSAETKYRLKATAFLTIIGGVGVLAGFSGAVAAVKKQDPSSFNQGLATANIINKVIMVSWLIGKRQCFCTKLVFEH